jgi:hypothetical protein
MTSMFGCSGVTWGTKSRGKALPDGRLTFRGLRATVLYDCKAARRGYDMEYRDLVGFVDYLNDYRAYWEPKLLRLEVEHGPEVPVSARIVEDSAIRHARVGPAGSPWTRPPVVRLPPP